MESLKEDNKSNYREFDFHEKSDDEPESMLHLSFQTPVPQQKHALHVVIEYPEYD